MTNISDRIRILRTSAGLTQEEMGKVLGVVKSTISSYEKGVNCPNDEMKIKICKYFCVSLEFLLGLSSETELRINESMQILIGDGSGNSRLLDTLEGKGMSINDLSIATGIEANILDNWFKVSIPTLQQLILVSDALDISLDYLLARDKHWSNSVTTHKESFEIDTLKDPLLMDINEALWPLSTEAKTMLLAQIRAVRALEGVAVDTSYQS